MLSDSLPNSFGTHSPSCSASNCLRDSFKSRLNRCALPYSSFVTGLSARLSILTACFFRTTAQQSSQVSPDLVMQENNSCSLEVRNCFIIRDFCSVDRH